MVDNNTDHLNLWKAMEAQVDAGRARSIGLSNFSSRQVKRIVQNCRIQPANLQIELHVYFQQRELAAFCRALDISVCAYAPLGSPGLVEFLKNRGTDTSSVPSLSPMSDPVVKKIAQKHKRTPAQVLLRHIIERGIVVIPKSINPNRMKENINIFDFELTEEDEQELYALDKGSAARMFSDRAANRFLGHPENPFADRY
ncbi:Aldo-keto reductase AKR2E4 [Gryllus bimaculatus]|nr:Aldo-keto reductase AKR2E4 [Gryllus bimaculatus]